MNTKNHKRGSCAGLSIDLCPTIGEYKNSKNCSLKDQFLAVVNFLLSNQRFSTVDEIFTELVSSMPTISKNTINKILDALEEVEILEVLNIDYRLQNAKYVC